MHFWRRPGTPRVEITAHTENSAGRSHCKQRFIGLHSYLSWPNEAQRVLGNDQIATTLMAFKGNTISWFSGLFRSFSIASLFPFEVALNIGPELANRCVLERTGVFEPQDEQHIFEKFFWEECLPHR